MLGDQFVADGNALYLSTDITGIAAQARDAARTAFDVAAERYKAALERLDLVREGPRQEEIRRAEAEVQQARAMLLLAQAGELEVTRKRQELATLQATIARDRAAPPWSRS